MRYIERILYAKNPFQPDLCSKSKVRLIVCAVYRGPTPLPFLGNLHTIANLSPGYDAFLQWRKEYGNVYTYWMAERPIVAITDYKTIKETFIQDGDTYGGRYLFNEHIEIARGGRLNGVIMTEGDENRENRRFALQILREIGMGKSIIELEILDEVEHMIAELRSEMDSNINDHDILKRLDLASGSVINQVVFGYRFSGENEEEFMTLKRLMDESVKEMSKPIRSIVMLYPSLRTFPFFKTAFERADKIDQQTLEFLKAKIQKYTQKFEAEGLADSNEALPFVGMYLRAKQSGNCDVNNGSILFRDDALLQFCADIWGAGHETISTTLSFGILYLLLDVDSQSKMQEELDKIVAPDEKVTIAHKARLPYTNAVINEVQRLANLLPQNLFHRTMRDVELNGYILPKSTVVVPQISCVLFDEKIFPEPKRFKPERFLDKNGQLLKVEELIPFSAGKRICLGESLARMELFLFIANIFHTFKVRPVDPLNPPTSEKIAGFVVGLKHYEVRLQLRHSKQHSK
ncbi:cytochrome p450 domain-containing protein [Ditylenchus destructor]|uniref:Cytochrome p450 domain-containing protein n=1 Tax=Ditylenchus destructor TaxID=166010 RepID=A0AAD4N3Q2_9BILA|nr:cytochrome p450 domain-containing protein [Ditylenchus destructor]